MTLLPSSHCTIRSADRGCHTGWNRIVLLTQKQKQSKSCDSGIGDPLIRHLHTPLASTTETIVDPLGGSAPTIVLIIPHSSHNALDTPTTFVRITIWWINFLHLKRPPANGTKTPPPDAVSDVSAAIITVPDVSSSGQTFVIASVSPASNTSYPIGAHNVCQGTTFQKLNSRCAAQVQMTHPLHLCLPGLRRRINSVPDSHNNSGEPSIVVIVTIIDRHIIWTARWHTTWTDQIVPTTRVTIFAGTRRPGVALSLNCEIRTDNFSHRRFGKKKRNLFEYRGKPSNRGSADDFSKLT